MRKVLYIMGHLSEQDVEWMARQGSQRRLNTSELLISEGVESPSLFIVLEGEVEVTVAGVGRVAMLGSGEILGEMSFVDNAPPSATVRASVSAKVLALEKAEIKGRLAHDVAFAGRFYKALAVFLADRLRGTISRQRAGSQLGNAVVEEDELDDAVLDNVSQAGLRFQQMLETLARVQVTHLNT